jgi:hypothetical protein
MENFTLEGHGIIGVAIKQVDICIRQFKTD